MDIFLHDLENKFRKMWAEDYEYEKNVNTKKIHLSMLKKTYEIPVQSNIFHFCSWFVGLLKQILICLEL